MIRNVTRLLLAAVFAVGILEGGAVALTLTGATSPTTPSITTYPTAQHPGYVCQYAAHDVQLLSAGPNAAFQTAFFVRLQGEWDPTGWTLTFAPDPLDITLDISDYQAVSDGPASGGAEIRAEWTPKPEEQDMKWAQTLHTNRSRHPGTDWCMDILRTSPNQPPLYPYSYADQHLYDRPERGCEPDQHIFWDAYTYLVRINRPAKTLTVYEGIYWGFTVDCTPVPEPAGIMVAASGVVWILLRKLR